MTATGRATGAKVPEPRGAKADDLAALDAAAGIDRIALARRAARLILQLVLRDGFHADVHFGAGPVGTARSVPARAPTTTPRGATYRGRVRIEGLAQRRHARRVTTSERIGHMLEAVVEGFVVVAARYEIAVRGRLGGALVRSLDDLEVWSSEPGVTYLGGWFADQPALHAVLARLADLGVELLSVRRLPDAE
jgi:hypothetical protein